MASARSVAATHARRFDEAAAALTRVLDATVWPVDDPVRNYFPMPRDASGQGDVLVGRIRQDTSDPTGHSISMFVAGDQLLKGAALNAVQIAKVMVERGWVRGK